MTPADHEAVQFELRAEWKRAEAAEARVSQVEEQNARLFGAKVAAEAERDRARDALRRIADWPVAVHVDPASDVRLIRREARAALGDKPPSELPRPYGRSVTDYPA